MDFHQRCVDGIQIWFAAHCHGSCELGLEHLEEEHRKVEKIGGKLELPFDFSWIKIFR